MAAVELVMEPPPTPHDDALMEVTVVFPPAQPEEDPDDVSVLVE